MGKHSRHEFSLGIEEKEYKYNSRYKKVQDSYNERKYYKPPEKHNGPVSYAEFKYIPKRFFKMPFRWETLSEEEKQVSMDKYGDPYGEVVYRNEDGSPIMRKVGQKEWPVPKFTDEDRANRSLYNARKATFKEMLKIMLDEVNPETGKTYREDIIASMVAGAIGGSVKKAEFVRDTAGEKPSNKVEVSSNNITVNITGDGEAEVIENTEE